MPPIHLYLARSQPPVRTAPKCSGTRYRYLSIMHREARRARMPGVFPQRDPPLFFLLGHCSLRREADQVSAVFSRFSELPPLKKKRKQQTGRCARTHKPATRARFCFCTFAVLSSTSLGHAGLFPTLDTLHRVLRQDTQCAAGWRVGASTSLCISPRCVGPVPQLAN